MSHCHEQLMFPICYDLRRDWLVGFTTFLNWPERSDIPNLRLCLRVIQRPGSSFEQERRCAHALS